VAVEIRIVSLNAHIRPVAAGHDRQLSGCKKSSTSSTPAGGELTAVDQYLIHGEMYADMGFPTGRKSHCTNPTTSASTPAR
jgi:hypothetical protein